jgi:hypothetical protein
MGCAPAGGEPVARLTGPGTLESKEVRLPECGAYPSQTLMG